MESKPWGSRASTVVSAAKADGEGALQSQVHLLHEKQHLITLLLLDCRPRFVILRPGITFSMHTKAEPDIQLIKLHSLRQVVDLEGF